MKMLYLIQVKSKSIFKLDTEKGKAKAFIMFMEFDNLGEKISQKKIHSHLIDEFRTLYPQFCKDEDKPIFSIRRSNKKEANFYVKNGYLEQQSFLLKKGE